MRSCPARSQAGTEDETALALTLSQFCSKKWFHFRIHDGKLLTIDKERIAPEGETGMLSETPKNLDALIREEKQRVAAEFIQEAWNGAIQEGIEPCILAESGLVAILTRYHAHGGEKAVVKLISSLSDRLDSGHFDANRVLQ